MFESIPFEEIDDILASGRVRGYWEDVVKAFDKQAQEAAEAGEAKFGTLVDLNGKSVAAVRAGLTNACKKLDKDYRVIAKADEEKVYLIALLDQ